MSYDGFGSEYRDSLMEKVIGGIYDSAEDSEVQEAIEAAKLLANDFVAPRKPLVSADDLTEFMIRVLRLTVKLRNPLIASDTFRPMGWLLNRHSVEVSEGAAREFGVFRYATELWGAYEHGGKLFPKEGVVEALECYLDSLEYLSQILALVSLVEAEGVWIIKLRNELGKVKYEAEKRVIDHSLRPWLYPFYSKAYERGLGWLIPSEIPGKLDEK